MTAADLLRGAFVSLEVNADFTEATLSMRDDSWLAFRHPVGERWVKAVAADEGSNDPTDASRVLALIAGFRLNARHLDIHFADGSRWEALLRASGQAR
jgi:hypothetical protein